VGAEIFRFTVMSIWFWDPFSFLSNGYWQGRIKLFGAPRQ